MKDYLAEKENIQPFYNRFPTIKNFEAQIIEKSENFNDLHRAVLHEVLLDQYHKITASESTLKNISLLKNNNSFTITTGHQLNLFTGPLYFLYKIITTLNLCKELKQKYSDKDFVPVYWMATEDHDFDEINYFNFRGKKFVWEREHSGPVGRISTDGLDKFLTVYASELGQGKRADELIKLFQESYLNHDNLAEATRYLANALFGDYGLVILDADDAKLKQQFTPYLENELLHQTAHAAVIKTIEKLAPYDIQVNPREINLFYIGDNLRERIILGDGIYVVHNTDLKFTKAEMLNLLHDAPERFSPNVVLRPLYQEVILPNLCYIGGGGEIAYWLELKSYFNVENITFPILLHRNSALLTNEKQLQKLGKLHLTWRELFLSPIALANNQMTLYSDFALDFSEQKAHLRSQFANLNEMAAKTDPSFVGAVSAQERKQIKGLENLEKKLLRAEKMKHADMLIRIATLQKELFPNDQLQERFANFSEFFLEKGEALIPEMVSQLNPFDQSLDIITL